ITVALLAPALVAAQTNTTTTPSSATAPLGLLPSQQVAQLAPQLVAFAGGQVNFNNLVNGLALGSTVTLNTVLPTGQIQTVTFTPQGTMTTTQIAQTLELARQSLISRGVAAPTSQQVAVALPATCTLPACVGSAPPVNATATCTT